MQSLVGIFRDQADLIRALEDLEKLKDRAEHVSVVGSRLFNPAWHLTQDLRSMLTVSEAVTRARLLVRKAVELTAGLTIPDSTPSGERKTVWSSARETR